MSTREVADYLRIKERKVYDLVAQRRIPCTRAAGKWLFPKELIDLWLLNSAEGLSELPAAAAPPAILSGSHDPLLDWAVRESGCGLALLCNGSLDGLERFCRRESLGCGMHVFDPDSGDYNVPLLQRRLATSGVVALEWARRVQGLIVVPERAEALAADGVAGLRGLRIAGRQKEAGSHLLLLHLLAEAGLGIDDITLLDPPPRSESDVAEAVADGRADAGLGIAAAAARQRLGFVALTEERYDLLVWRRHYFEPPLQTLLRFCQQPEFHARAKALGGYCLDDFGSVRFNSA